MNRFNNNPQIAPVTTQAKTNCKNKIMKECKYNLSDKTLMVCVRLFVTYLLVGNSPMLSILNCLPIQRSNKL